MLTVQYAQSFKDRGFTFIALAPGVSDTPARNPHRGAYRSDSLILSSPKDSMNHIQHRQLTMSPLTKTLCHQWLKTDLGGEQADLTPTEGAEASVKILLGVQGDAKANGKFFEVHVPGWENNPGINQYAGGIAPW